MKFCLSFSDLVIHGIINGTLNPDIKVIGSCSGKESSSFKCEGMRNYIKWNVNLENSDFKIESEFKVDQIDAKAVVLALWSGGRAPIVQVPVETNLNPNEFKTIEASRSGNSLKITLDGMQLQDKDLATSIDAVGWVPWRNTIYIKSLKLNYGNSEIKYKENTFNLTRAFL